MEKNFHVEYLRGWNSNPLGQKKFISTEKKNQITTCTCNNKCLPLVMTFCFVKDFFLGTSVSNLQTFK